MERVGFVGLGIMGAPMARNALRAGFAVTVTNRTRSRAEPLSAEGASVVATPREVAARSDLVVTMATTSPDVASDWSTSCTTRFSGTAVGAKATWRSSRSSSASAAWSLGYPRGRASGVT